MVMPTAWSVRCRCSIGSAWGSTRTFSRPPMAISASLAPFSMPETRADMATRLETPRMMPSIVSSDRNLCAQISRNPARTVMPSCAERMAEHLRREPWTAARSWSGRLSRHCRDGAVPLQAGEGQINLLRDLAVANFDAARRDGGDFRVVRDQHDGAAFLAELAKEAAGWRRPCASRGCRSVRRQRRCAGC